MTVGLTIRHELQASVEQFWTDIFGSEDFNHALYVERLGFGYELEARDPGTGYRRAKIWPSLKLPKTLARVLGDRVSFVEEGTFDRAAERYDFRIVPSTLSDRIRVDGSVLAARLDDRTCERTVQLEIEAHVLGLGHIIETFLATNTREQYDENAAFINEYLAAKR